MRLNGGGLSSNVLYWMAAKNFKNMLIVANKTLRKADG